MTTDEHVDRAKAILAEGGTCESAIAHAVVAIAELLNQRKDAD
jgi:hypothetical protein